MTSAIRLSGLPSFWTDTNLRQMLAQFGTVVSAAIVREPFGHSLGLGIASMRWPTNTMFRAAKAESKPGP